MAKRYVHEIVLRVTTKQSDHASYKYEIENGLGYCDWDGDEFEVVHTKNLSEKEVTDEVTR